MPLASATAAARSVFIFQLPAISLRRMVSPESRVERWIAGARAEMPNAIAIGRLLTHDSATSLPDRLGLRIGAEHFEAQGLFRERGDGPAGARLALVADELDEEQIAAAVRRESGTIRSRSC